MKLLCVGLKGVNEVTTATIAEFPIGDRLLQRLRNADGVHSQDGTEQWFVRPEIINNDAGRPCIQIIPTELECALLGLLEAAGWNKLQTEQLARFAVNSALENTPARNSAAEVFFSGAKLLPTQDGRTGTRILQAVRVRDNGAGRVIFNSAEERLEAAPKLTNIDLDLSAMVGLTEPVLSFPFSTQPRKTGEQRTKELQDARSLAVERARQQAPRAELFAVRVNLNVEWAAGQFHKVGRNTAPRQAEQLLSELLGGIPAGILTMAFQVDSSNAPIWNGEISIVMREKKLVEHLVQMLKEGPLRIRKAGAPITCIRLRHQSQITVVPVAVPVELRPEMEEAHGCTLEDLTAVVLKAVHSSDAGFATLPWKDNDGSEVKFRKNDGLRPSLEQLPAVEDGMVPDGQGLDLRTILSKENIRTDSETLFDSLCFLLDNGTMVVVPPDDENPGPIQFWTRIRFEDFYGSA